MTIAPTTASVGFALDRAEGDAPVSVEDAELLLHARGADLERLFDLASRLRDEGLVRAGRPGVITFSKKVFLPITNLCRDRCHYCIFVDTPGKLAKKGKSLYMSEEQILVVARQGAAMGCKEALFTLGDRPEDRWPDARAWLDEHGFASTIDYVRHMAKRVLEETGLLPHMNPGVMTRAEMEQLRPFAPSMGMMLETTSVRLWADKGEVHYGSPDKEPAVRLKVLEDAGLARVPLTTGVLVGIGENHRERAESLVAIRESHARHGHIQETIVQNFRAKPATASQNAPDLGTVEFGATVAVARVVMGSDARIQVPPNLSDASELAMLVRAGVDDWGGVSPLTADHVNPERPWPSLTDLADLTQASGFELRERLTVHSSYIADAAIWLDAAVLPRVTALLDPATLLADESARPSGDLPHRGTTIALHSSAFGAALARAEESPAGLTDDQYTALLGAASADLEALTALASDVRRYTVGEAVSFAANRNITSSFLTTGSSRSTGSSREKLTLLSVADITHDAWGLGATEVCVQGLISADVPASSYVDIARAVKGARPDIHLHAFRPADVADGADRAGVSDDEFLAMLQDAGVDTMPGTGVKLLDEGLRRRFAPEDLSIDRWISIVTAAHRRGLRSSSVMVYGLGETDRDRVAHLRKLVAIQRETAGFTEFVPMPALGGGSTVRDHRAVHAVARLMLHGSIDHIQVPWTRVGLDGAATLLQAGADDLGGTLFDGRVLPQVGIEVGNSMTLDDARRITRSISRPLRQRTTGYGEPTDERKAAVVR